MAMNDAEDTAVQPLLNFLESGQSLEEFNEEWFNTELSKLYSWYSGFFTMGRIHL